AATRERERLARRIHDSVLQVLAMVQRRGGELGGEAAELGRLAGAQEAALRSLSGSRPRVPEAGASSGAAAAGGAEVDLRSALTGHASPSVTVSTPATEVQLAAHADRQEEAVGAAAHGNGR